MSQGGSNKKVSNSLLALSSAAIFAVYSAGYSRTQSAANRFAAADGRRPPIPIARASEPVVRITASPAPVASESKPEVALRRERPVSAQPAPAKTDPPPSVPTTVETPAPTTPAAELPPVIPEPKVEVPAVVAPPVVAPAPPPPAAPAAPAHPVWKDGTYTGWGYSRHGDIQAAVVIEDNRIKSSTIITCNTRYDCSRIDDIIQQPVKRQSPDVDNVSGATQSADAYYYAVVEALAKAK